MHVLSFKKTVLLHFGFVLFTIKLWLTLVIPDHSELREKPELAAKHCSVQLGFSLQSISKFTPNWLKHNSGNWISSWFPPEGWIWIWNRISSTFCEWWHWSVSWHLRLFHSWYFLQTIHHKVYSIFLRDQLALSVLENPLFLVIVLLECCMGIKRQE